MEWSLGWECGKETGWMDGRAEFVVQTRRARIQMISNGSFGVSFSGIYSVGRDSRIEWKRTVFATWKIIVVVHTPYLGLLTGLVHNVCLPTICNYSIHTQLRDSIYRRRRENNGRGHSHFY